MKKLYLSGFSIFLLLISGYPALAQDETTDQITVQLTDPAKPAFIELHLINGGINVIGYDGKEVIIETKIQSKQVSANKDFDCDYEAVQARELGLTNWVAVQKPEKVEEKSKDKDGMIRIPVQSTSIEVEEDDNHIQINTESWKRTIDVSIKVPVKTSLQLNCVNNGDINVENVDGNFDVENINGKITLKNISGSVNAHALNKSLDVIFNRVDAGKPMSFSTMNGDIDVTFPGTVKCDVKIKADNGEVYSDYEIVRVNKSKQMSEENKRGKDGKYRVLIEKAFFGSINGGGAEYQFTSFNGDMYIRKAK